MRDAVGEELQRRWSEPWPWRSALGAALVFHAVVAALLTISPAHRSRSLQLPSVQVRMVSPLAATARRPSAPATQPASRPVRAAAPAPQKRPPAAKAPVHPPAPPARSAVSAAKSPPPAPPAPARSDEALAPDAADAASGAGRGEPGALHSPAGAIALGPGNGASEEPFPFSYYLTRFVSVVESNWFRPPAPTETRCRVRCRIDRSGRLAEAGIEEESAVPAFDRAALRAIYASAPFPPLPEGFTGQSLTLHLDFGPQ